MKENMKQVYLTPAVEVKVVAVENGFFNSDPIDQLEAVGSFQSVEF